MVADFVHVEFVVVVDSVVASASAAVELDLDVVQSFVAVVVGVAFAVDDSVVQPSHWIAVAFAADG